MEIKYKLYPYPVLSSYSNDYGNGSFDVAIDIVRDGYDLRIDFLAKRRLLRAESAGYEIPGCQFWTVGMHTGSEQSSPARSWWYWT